jgi:hypothetical protein
MEEGTKTICRVKKLDLRASIHLICLSRCMDYAEIRLIEAPRNLYRPLMGISRTNECMNVAAGALMAA